LPLFAEVCEIHKAWFLGKYKITTSLIVASIVAAREIVNRELIGSEVGGAVATTALRSVEVLIRAASSALEALILRLVVGTDGRAARGDASAVDGSAVAILLTTTQGGAHRRTVEGLLQLVPLRRLVAGLTHRVTRLYTHHAKHSDSGHAGIGGLVMGHGSL